MGTTVHDMVTVEASCWLLVLLGLAVLLPGCASQNTTARDLCPGISGGVCGRDCQLHICKALGRFYRATLNESDPWDNEYGWELTTTMPCEKLVGPGGRRQAVYCSWFGITCCTPQAVAAGHCSTVNSVYGIQMPINNLNASVGNIEVVQPMQQVHDCGMRVLNLEANNLVGQFHLAWGGLKHLLVFNFGNCWITGSIPNSMRSMRNLTQINLSNNWLNGTLPAWLEDFQQLNILNLGSQFGDNEGTDAVGLMGPVPKQLSKLKELRELNLESNALTGELPVELCNGDDSQLLVLSIRGNSLSGNATVVESCGNLVQLDLSDNHFTGPLPASEYWQELASYRTRNNRFTGTLPVKLATTARILEHLDISNNLLTGRFPNQITILSGLKTLLMSGNKFTGTLTEDLFYLPSLLTLDVSNNSFIGTIHGAIGLAYSLQSIDYSNNPGITGRIPPEMGLLKGLQVARLQNTSLSCSGIIKPYSITTNASCSDPARCRTPRYFGSAETKQHVCSPKEQLPCFLRFSEYLLPREDSSNMRCKYIIRLLTDKAMQACSGSEPTDLGDYAELLPSISPEAYEQSWYVDPSYFQYQQCDCLLGYRAEWDEPRTTLTCVPENAGSYQRTAVIVGSIAGALVLCLLLLVWRQYLTTRPRWLRERIMQSKRTKGAPKCAKQGDKVTVSIVVTDVKDFSELTRKCPELMNKAMGGHNNILRKACHTHAGYVMDQEGDSWSVAFHDAEDAVAFSLQVQQALAQKVWGMRLGASEAALAELRNMTTLRDEGFSTKYSSGMHTASTPTPAAAPNLLSNSQESSLNSLPDRMAASVAAASMQQRVIQQGAAAEAAASDAPSIPRAGLSFTGPSFTSSIWHGGPDGSTSSHSDLNQLVQPSSNSMDAAAAAASRRLLSVLWFGKARRTSSGSRSSLQRADTSDTDVMQDAGTPQHVHDRDNREFGSNTPKASQQQQQQQQLAPPGLQPDSSSTAIANDMGGSWHNVQGSEQAAAGHSLAQLHCKSSFGSSVQCALLDRTNGSMSHKASDSSSRLWMNGAAAIMRRVSQFGRHSTSQARPMPTANEQVPVQVLRLALRVGIATGPLPYGVDVSNCTVKDRAKDLICDVANAGQILMDEATFLLVKDSLSVLGTVNDGGYDDQMLQQLMQSQTIGKLQQQVACGACARRQHSSQSFTSDILAVDHQDYDSDALVVHMGCFEVPAPSTGGSGSKATYGSALHTAPSPDGQIELVVPRSAAAAAAAAAARTSKHSSRLLLPHAKQQLHLYSVAAPGMRQRAISTDQLSRLMSWSDPVNMRPGWVQVQKGFWEAPAARQMDLSPSTPLYQASQGPLPDVTIVFASVAGASSFTFKRSRSDTRFVNKVIRRCMLQQLSVLPGGDGYLCRCQEADLKYMIAFEHPHRAVQWCLAVQEALMYINWPANVLNHPGFEQVLDPETGLPLFRGPRLCMGLTEGQPNSVIPDHTGRANYWGSCVNRAARYTDAAAHGGQVVTDIDLLRKVMAVWAAQDRDDSADDTAESNIQELPPPIEARPREHHQQPPLPPPPQQQQQPQQPERQVQQVRQEPPQQPASPASVAGGQAGQLPVWSRAKRWSHLASPTADGDPQGLLVPAQRSRSETYTARQVTFNLPLHPQHMGRSPQAQQLPQQRPCLQQLRGGSCSSSFTYGARPRLSAAGTSSSVAEQLRSSTFQVLLPQVSLPSASRAAGLTDLPEAGLTITSPDGVAPAQCEPAHAMHLGTFVFKGSGEYRMVHILHASLAARQFPAEPPKGKGQRLVQASGAVEGLEAVNLQIPQCLLEARRVFLAGL